MPLDLCAVLSCILKSRSWTLFKLRVLLSYSKTQDVSTFNTFLLWPEQMHKTQHTVCKYSTWRHPPPSPRFKDAWSGKTPLFPEDRILICSDKASAADWLDILCVIYICVCVFWFVAVRVLRLRGIYICMHPVSYLPPSPVIRKVSGLVFENSIPHLALYLY